MNPWPKPSYFNFTSDEAGKLTGFIGDYYLYGSIRLKFSAHVHSDDKSRRFRGTIRAISPIDNSILQVIGQEKKNRLKRYSEEDLQKKKNLSSLLYVSCELNTSAQEEEKICEYIHSRAVRLFTENAPLITARYRLATSPDRITPALACVLYVDDFLSERFADKANTEKDEAELEKQKQKETDALIDFFCYFLDNTVPMSGYSSQKHKLQAQFSAYQDRLGKKFTRATKGLIQRYWQYCLSRNICIGCNPLAEEHTARKSDKVAAAKADRPDVMSSDLQRKWEDYILTNPTGEACGLALMYSGFSAADACSFRWRDILLDPVRDDFVCVKYIRPDLAGTLHDFTRPLIPTSAVTLRLRYLELLATFTAEEVSAMPVASLLKDTHKAIQKDYLVQLAKKALAGVGLLTDNIRRGQRQLPVSSINTTILQKTYEYNLRNKCGISDDGTFLFLLGRSLSSLVTYSSYTSLACPEGLERLYTLLRPCACRHKNEVENSTVPQAVDEHTEQLVFTPEFTNRRISVSTVLTLRPGEEFILKCPHGVTGDIDVVSRG